MSSSVIASHKLNDGLKNLYIREVNTKHAAIFVVYIYKFLS